MRKWGIVISVLYALIRQCIIAPGAVFLYGDKNSSWQDFLQGIGEAYSNWLFWIPAGAVLASQALLLFLSVDASQKGLRPRAHILVSCIAAAVLTALLTSGIVWSLGFAIHGDD